MSMSERVCVRNARFWRRAGLAILLMPLLVAGRSAAQGYRPPPSPPVFQPPPSPPAYQPPLSPSPSYRPTTPSFPQVRQPVSNPFQDLQNSWRTDQQIRNSIDRMRQSQGALDSIARLRRDEEARGWEQSRTESLLRQLRDQQTSPMSSSGSQRTGNSPLRDQQANPGAPMRAGPGLQALPGAAFDWSTVSSEDRAASRFQMALYLRSDGLYGKAGRYCREIIAAYPQTKTAEKARKLLEEMPSADVRMASPQNTTNSAAIRFSTAQRKRLQSAPRFPVH